MVSKLKKCLFIISLLFIYYIFNASVYAASLSITTSKSTVKPGESFTVTIKLNNGAGKVRASVSNGTGSLGNTWLDNSSASFSCTAGSKGSITISASGEVADYTTAEDENVSKSKTISIEEPKATSTTTSTSTTSSKTSTNKNYTKNVEQKDDKKETKVEEQNNNEEEKVESVEEVKYLIEKLEIKNGTLMSEFNSEVYEYEVKAIEIEKLDFIANTVPENLNIEVLGNENLKIGENIITINLKGQDDKAITTYSLRVINEKSELTIANENIESLKRHNFILKITTGSYALLSMILISVLMFKNKKY